MQIRGEVNDWMVRARVRVSYMGVVLQQRVRSGKRWFTKVALPRGKTAVQACITVVAKGLKRLKSRLSNGGGTGGKAVEKGRPDRGTRGAGGTAAERPRPDGSGMATPTRKTGGAEPSVSRKTTSSEGEGGGAKEREKTTTLPPNVVRVRFLAPGAAGYITIDGDGERHPLPYETTLTVGAHGLLVRWLAYQDLRTIVRVAREGARAVVTITDAGGNRPVIREAPMGVTIEVELPLVERHDAASRGLVASGWYVAPGKGRAVGPVSVLS